MANHAANASIDANWLNRSHARRIARIFPSMGGSRINVQIATCTKCG